MTEVSPPDQSCEVYFEFTVVGQVVRVAAIDALSGTEIVVMGPVSASRSDLQRLALGKLKARLAAANPSL